MPYKIICHEDYFSNLNMPCIKTLRCIIETRGLSTRYIYEDYDWVSLKHDQLNYDNNMLFYYCPNIGDLSYYILAKTLAEAKQLLFNTACASLRIFEEFP